MTSQTRSRKKQVGKTVSRERVVYEVRGPRGSREVVASSVVELKKALSTLLDMDPYSLQAVAHIAHVERATVQGNGWSIKRLGVLSFVPDSPTDAKSAQRSSSRQQEEVEQRETPQVAEPHEHEEVERKETPQVAEPREQHQASSVPQHSFQTPEPLL